MIKEIVAANTLDNNQYLQFWLTTHWLTITLIY